MQSPVYAMLPSFVKALGPVKEWFSTWFISTFIAKYKDISDTASFEKVPSNTESGLIDVYLQQFQDMRLYCLGPCRNESPMSILQEPIPYVSSAGNLCCP